MIVVPSYISIKPLFQGGGSTSGMGYRMLESTTSRCIGILLFMWEHVGISIGRAPETGGCLLWDPFCSV